MSPPQCVLKCSQLRSLTPLHADAEIWKGAPAAEELGDAYMWGRVDIPEEHGVIVEVDAGAYVLAASLFSATSEQAGLSLLVMQETPIQLP